MSYFLDSQSLEHRSRKQESSNADTDVGSRAMQGAHCRDGEAPRNAALLDAHSNVLH